MVFIRGIHVQMMIFHCLGIFFSHFLKIFSSNVFLFRILSYLCDNKSGDDLHFSHIKTHTAMSTILKNQYSTAKEILAKVEVAQSFYDASIELKMSQEKTFERFKDLDKLYNLFMVVMGNAKIMFYSDSYAKNTDHAKKQFTACNEYFAQYEKELLESGAIEYGDTLTEEQKLAYYHQQELEQQYYHEFECQY